MIRLKCPTCARGLGIDECHAGKLALCPGCNHTFTVPVPAVVLEEPPPAPHPPTLDPLPPQAGIPPDDHEPLLPEGPIGLAPEDGPGTSPPPPAPAEGLAGLNLSLDEPSAPSPDPWALTRDGLRDQPAA